MDEPKPELKGAAEELFEELTEVLDRGDKEILDGLFPKSAPASSFQTMTVSCIREAAFHQMLPTFAIGPCRSGVSLPFCSIQKDLIAVPMDRAPALGSGAKGM